VEELPLLTLLAGRLCARYAGVWGRGSDGTPLTPLKKKLTQDEIVGARVLVEKVLHHPGMSTGVTVMVTVNTQDKIVGARVLVENVHHHPGKGAVTVNG
jgi:hypothetical protein